MTAKPDVTHEELGQIPLLRGLAGNELDELIALCEPAEASKHVLFEEGSAAEAFYLLTRGSVTLYQGDAEMHTLRPMVVIGEVGALTGRNRMTRAVVSDDAEVWQIRVDAFKALIDRNNKLGLHFEATLLDVLADKLRRDQLRLQDMRTNIITTQKALKRMRDFVDESPETELSARLHGEFEALIAQNRRVNYRVEPPDSLRATLRLDDGTEASVVQISRRSLTVEGQGGAKGDRISGVLYLSGPEIPISGRITGIDDGQVDIGLDLLLDEYADKLEGYLTRVQMVDFLV